MPPGKGRVLHLTDWANSSYAPTRELEGQLLRHLTMGGKANRGHFALKLIGMVQGLR